MQVLSIEELSILDLKDYEIMPIYREELMQF